MPELTEKLKGQIGIVTLAIGMVPMVLMMILAGYQLSDTELDASLTASLNSNQKGFQAQIMLNQILSTEETRENIRELPYASSRSDKEDEIESVVNTYMEGNVDEWDFHVYYPEADDFYVRTSQQAMGTDTRGKATLASPEGDVIFITLNIDGSVAQAYDPTSSYRSGNNHYYTYGGVP